MSVFGDNGPRWEWRRGRWSLRPVVEDPPEMCPMGCGRTTDDIAGGPCQDCWEEAS